MLRSYHSARLLARTIPAALALAAGSLHATAQTRCVPCEARLVPITYWGGYNDNFNTAGPVEMTTPRAGLQSWYQSTYPQVQFDQAANNNRFIHTFQNLPVRIVSARLTLQLRADCSQPETDSINLQRNASGGFAWSYNLNSLIPGGWTCNRTTTLVLDLCRLPLANGSTTSIIPLITGKYLDIGIADDTTVDYARLDIEVCPCTRPFVWVQQAGVFDNGAVGGGDKPTSRSSNLSSIRTTAPFLWKDFDDCTQDRGVGHTFPVALPGVLMGKLLVQMGPCPTAYPNTGGSNNDSIFLDQRPAGSGALGTPANFWAAFNMATIPGNIWPGSWLPGLNPMQPFLFSLETTPTATSNMLGGLADGAFDVYVQDDSVVDAMKLILATCNPVPIIWGVPSATLGDAFAASNPSGTIDIGGIGPSGDDGVTFEAGSADGAALGLSNIDLSASDASIRAQAMLRGPDGEVPVTGLSVAREGSQLRLSVTGQLPAGARVLATAYDGENEVGRYLLPEGERSVLVDDSGGGGGAQCSIFIDASGGGWRWDPFLGDWVTADIMDDPFWNWWFNGPRRQVQFPGALLGFNRLSLAFAAPEIAGDFAAIQVTGTSVPSLSATAAGIYGLGMPLTGLGSGAIQSSHGTVAISNLGSTGNDGVRIHTGAVVGAELDIQAPDASTQVTDGEWLIWTSALRAADGSTHEDSLRIITHPIGADIQAGAPGGMVRVTLKRQGQIVAEGTVPSGVVVTSSGIPRPRAVALTDGSSGHPAGPQYSMMLDEMVWLSISGNDGVLADSIEVLAEDPGVEGSVITAIELRSAAQSNFTLTGVRVTPAGSAPTCPADFNQDGGIDGADIEAFFAAWDNGDGSADVNQDGGIDGSDVQTFFDAWSNGGC